MNKFRKIPPSVGLIPIHKQAVNPLPKTCRSPSKCNSRHATTQGTSLPILFDKRDVKV